MSVQVCSTSWQLRLSYRLRSAGRNQCAISSKKSLAPQPKIPRNDCAAPPYDELTEKSRLMGGAGRCAAIEGPRWHDTRRAASIWRVQAGPVRTGRMGGGACPGPGGHGKHGHLLEKPYAALAAAGIRTPVVNARHVKNVPGRKTDAASNALPEFAPHA